jgi:AbrB family looped-hinge helix DNA binding protein
MGTLYSRISGRGQLVIPAKLRKVLGLRPGTQIALKLVGGAILAQPITEHFIDSIPGSLGGPSLAALREREHRNERQH